MVRSRCGRQDLFLYIKEEYLTVQSYGRGAGPDSSENQDQSTHHYQLYKVTAGHRTGATGAGGKRLCGVCLLQCYRVFAKKKRQSLERCISKGQQVLSHFK